MSQLLRLGRSSCSRSYLWKSVDLPHILATEIFRLQGCHSCRAFRAGLSQVAHQSSPKPAEVRATHVQEKSQQDSTFSFKDKTNSPVRLKDKDKRRIWAKFKEQENLSRLADLKEKGICVDGFQGQKNKHDLKPFIYIDEWGLQLRKFQSKVFQNDSRSDIVTNDTSSRGSFEKSVTSKSGIDNKILDNTINTHGSHVKRKKGHVETSVQGGGVEKQNSPSESLSETESHSARHKKVHHVMDKDKTSEVPSRLNDKKQNYFEREKEKVEPEPSQKTKTISVKEKDQEDRQRTSKKSEPLQKRKTANVKKKESKDKEKKKCAQVSDDLLLEDKERKREHFNNDFKSFMDACLFTNQVDMAYHALKMNRLNQAKKQEYLVTDVTSYSCLLHYYSRIGDVFKTVEIMKWMKVNGVKPNMDCYAAFLYCLGNQEEFDMERAGKVLNDIESEGLDIRNIFNESFLMRNEKAILLQVLNHLIEGFTPNLPPTTVPYNNPLLNELNEPLDPSEMEEKNPYHGVMAPEELMKQTDRQIDIESKDVIQVKSIEKMPKLTEHDLEMSKRLHSLKANWRRILLHDYKKELRSLERREKGRHDICISPFLKLFRPEEYVDLLMGEVQRLCVGSDFYSPTTSSLWYDLGQRVFKKYVIKVKENNKIIDQIRKQHRDFVHHYSNSEFMYKNHRECYLDVCRKHADGYINELDIHRWSYHLQKRIGKKLYDLIMNKLKIDSHILSEDLDTTPKMIPAFYQVFRSYSGRTKAEVKPHPVLLKLYHGNYITEIPFETSELPMLVPPLPWYAANKGGYLIGQADIMKFDEYFHEKSIVNSVPSHQLNGVFDALNILDMCPWRINKPMLEIVISLFNRKGDKNLDIPPPPSECPAPPLMTPDMTAEQKMEIKMRKKQLKQQKNEMYSLWCNELYKLSIANQYKDDVFWFPHNLDFRGRTYPCPPHFNHLGSDVTRSIICFAKGKPLGKDGLDWLKIHLINLTGFRKRSSNHERLEFANEVMEDILDSADNPIYGNKWWQTSDEPWQTLAACKEIAMATRSPDPENYICHFPVHQDGSCNGLQHYAALGRDQAGAESVNLCPFDAPQDVYSDVADLVEEVRQKDSSDGVEIAQVLEGFVRRKVIKQTVMTTVYGVTRYGARLQILRQLKDIPEFPEKHQWEASDYLTDATFKCLQKMFTSTKMIQDWFIECADKISHSCRRPVEWVTPLDLPVLQPYFRKKPVNIKGIASESLERNMYEKPNSIKQKNGFPPNYIHSLDSVHMMLTALHCWRAGITYVSVHDCYWTHPCDVGIMNKICRDQFVSLHSQPILEDLSKFMLEKFGDLPNDSKEREALKECLSRVPEKGTYNLNSVKKSTYFFS